MTDISTNDTNAITTADSMVVLRFSTERKRKEYIKLAESIEQAQMSITGISHLMGQITAYKDADLPVPDNIDALWKKLAKKNPIFNEATTPMAIYQAFEAGLTNELLQLAIFVATESLSGGIVIHRVHDDLVELLFGDDNELVPLKEEELDALIAQVEKSNIKQRGNA